MAGRLLLITTISCNATDVIYYYKLQYYAQSVSYTHLLGIIINFSDSAVKELRALKFSARLVLSAHDI